VAPGVPEILARELILGHEFCFCSLGFDVAGESVDIKVFHVRKLCFDEVGILPFVLTFLLSLWEVKGKQAGMWRGSRSGLSLTVYHTDLEDSLCYKYRSASYFETKVQEIERFNEVQVQLRKLQNTIENQLPLFGHCLLCLFRISFKTN
jgi:hypothetical protein